MKIEQIQKENEIKNDIIEAERKQMEEEIKKIKTETDKKKELDEKIKLI
jgi:hypothetical protein